ncbi:hypothetical protein L228DRAFT_85647 [Xylona heveae TC161]|uniref:Uncharacterized protein n=1 Tax=Xylona heveae (strain CBS 132557 / TC161) TaxID=1328760 RepID=A0A161TDK2_XYLHT|nr:hypothetical protein L228DRAFT_85647 [Xylona heveae TC161]KZF23947.1 hypothetical protein L228DRAFT_85647 [Xylona heveae TC161]
MSVSEVNADLRDPGGESGHRGVQHRTLTPGSQETHAVASQAEETLHHGGNLSAFLPLDSPPNNQIEGVSPLNGSNSSELLPSSFQPLRPPQTRDPSFGNTPISRQPEEETTHTDNPGIATSSQRNNRSESTNRQLSSSSVLEPSSETHQPEQDTQARDRISPHPQRPDETLTGPPTAGSNQGEELDQSESSDEEYYNPFDYGTIELVLPIEPYRILTEDWGTLSPGGQHVIIDDIQFQVNQSQLTEQPARATPTATPAPQSPGRIRRLLSRYVTQMKIN